MPANRPEAKLIRLEGKAVSLKGDDRKVADFEAGEKISIRNEDGGSSLGLRITRKVEDAQVPTFEGTIHLFARYDAHGTPYFYPADSEDKPNASTDWINLGVFCAFTILDGPEPYVTIKKLAQEDKPKQPTLSSLFPNTVAEPNTVNGATNDVSGNGQESAKDTAELQTN